VLYAGLTTDSYVSEDTIDDQLCLAVYGTVAGVHETAVFTFCCEEESDTEEWSTALTVCLAAFNRPSNKVKCYVISHWYMPLILLFAVSEFWLCNSAST
jgi:hypothetical protein